MFNPSRLTVARKRRGMTKTALAKRVKKTPRIISMYERGDSSPPDSTLSDIASSLNFPEAFFHREDLDEPSSESFRSLASMTAGQRDRARAAGALAIEIGNWIGDRFRLPPPDLPTMRGFEPEAAADAIRAHWGLGAKPCPNVVHVLEARGVRVFSLPRDSKSVHAFSFWHEGNPFVFLTTDTSGERGRFDAVHELGHLLLHRDGRIRGREAELEADRFASSFLMPRGSVFERAPFSPFLDHLIIAKRTWKVSLGALVRRLYQLGLLTEWQYRSLCIELSQRGYRTSEPNGIAREISQVFPKVFGVLRQEGMKRSKVARELGLRTADLDCLVFGLIVESGDGETTQPTPEGRKLRLL